MSTVRGRWYRAIVPEMQIRIGRFRFKEDLRGPTTADLLSEMRAKVLETLASFDTTGRIIITESPLFDLVEENEIIPEYEVHCYTGGHRFGVGVRRID